MLDGLPRRLAHVLGVARRAEGVAWVVPVDDRDLLVAAGFLHDVGYAPELRRTGLHQLDGAAFVASQGLPRLAALVAHHSASRFEIGLSSRSGELAGYPREQTALADALVYADLTTGPDGEPVGFEQRLAEVETRYDDGSVVVEALALARPHLQAGVRRTEQRLSGIELSRSA